MDFSVTVQDKVRLIRLDRQHRKNALTFPMYEGIAKALEEANTDNLTHLVVITGTGDYFSSGNDLTNYTAVSGNKGPAEMCEIVKRMLSAFIDCRKPVIALVNGSAVGVGVTMLGLCDVVFASSVAKFQTPFVSLGLSPEGCSSYLFPRIMGVAKASQMLYFCEAMTAQDAFIAGLVTEVLPENQFESLAWKKIHRWTELPIGSLMHSKELVQGPQRAILHKTNDDEWVRLLERFQSDECAEAIIKFFTKKSKV